MVDHKTVEQFLLSMEDAKLDYPFGEGVAVYKVFVPSASASRLDAAQGGSEEQARSRVATSSERKSVTDTALRQEPAGVASSASKQGKAVRGDWKMFALVQEDSDPLKISLKCEPVLAETLRHKYESVMPGYHLNKKHWNTILLTGQLEWPEVQDLIKLSYNLVTS